MNEKTAKLIETRNGCKKGNLISLPRDPRDCGEKFGKSYLNISSFPMQRRKILMLSLNATDTTPSNREMLIVKSLIWHPTLFSLPIKADAWQTIRYLEINNSYINDATTNKFVVRWCVVAGEPNLENTRHLRVDQNCLFMLHCSKEGESRSYPGVV